MHALVIDDDKTLLEITCDWLVSKFKDIRITQSHSGFEAIQIIENREAFDIIVSDYEMLDGTGLDVLKYLIAHKKTVPFILYTAHLRPELPKDLDRYFIGVIHKLDYTELLDTISDLRAKK